MSVKLSAATLWRVCPKTVGAPKYQRSDLKAGILHIGVGNFHRAHQAVYLDDLFNSGADRDWAIVGAGVREPDIAMREKLKAQDWLTTVVEQEADSTRGACHRRDDRFRQAVRRRRQSRRARRSRDPHRLADHHRRRLLHLARRRSISIPPIPTSSPTRRHPDAPKTAFGLIVAGLKKRRDAGVAPFTVMSCDNIPGNGHVTENAVVGLAELSDPALAAWIRGNVAFPNSMVDRITPATTDRERAILNEQWGVEDNWPVFCEEFRQWVVEDKFPSGRPALEKVGVTFTSDVAPYELMKIRILNGGHAAIAYPAGSARHPFRPRGDGGQADRRVSRDADQARDHSDRAAAARRRSRSLPQEGRRTVRQSEDRRHDFAPLPRRLQPPAEIHPADGFATGSKSGASVKGLALVSALWCRYCYGESESGKPIAPNDPNWERLQAAAKPARNDPQRVP